MATTQFNPTNNQIQAAKKVFIAMALTDVIRKNYTNIEQQVLNSGEYHYSPRYFEGKWIERGLSLPANRLIRDPKHDYMMDGLSEYCDNNSIDNDSARYYSELRRRCMNAGMIHGENALCKVENDLNKLENALIIETKPIHKLELDDVNMNMDNRRNLIELTLRLFGSLCKNTESNLKNAFYNEHISK